MMATTTTVMAVLQCASLRRASSATLPSAIPSAVRFVEMD